MRLTGVVFGGKIGLFESRGAIGGSRRVFLIIFGENEPEGEVDANVFRGLGHSSETFNERMSKTASSSPCTIIRIKGGRSQRR